MYVAAQLRLESALKLTRVILGTKHYC